MTLDFSSTENWFLLASKHLSPRPRCVNYN